MPIDLAACAVLGSAKLLNSSAKWNDRTLSGIVGRSETVMQDYFSSISIKGYVCGTQYGEIQLT